MRANTLEQKLSSSQAVFGAMVSFPESSVVEMLAYMGFDRVLAE